MMKFQCNGAGNIFTINLGMFLRKSLFLKLCIMLISVSYLSAAPSGTYAGDTPATEQRGTGVEPVVLAKAIEPESYTIQTGSFTTLTAAIEEFNDVAAGLAGLDGITLEYLRIEMIGKYYAVRIGVFAGYIAAEEFLQAARSRITGAIILNAHIRDERIIKLYGEDPKDKEEGKKSPEPLTPAAPPALEEAPMPSTPGPETELKAPTEAEEKKEEETALYQTAEQEERQTFLSKIGGRITLSDYYSTDSGDYNFHVASARLNLFKREGEGPGYYFEIDGKVRKKIINGDLRGNVPRYKVDEAWLGYVFPGEKVRMIAGRQYIQELYNTDIDGLNVNYSFRKGLGIGVFGGLAPDKFDDNLNGKYKSVGGYGFLNRNDHNINLGYEYLTYNGEPDREYFSFRAYSRLSKDIRLTGLSSVSKNQITHNYELENANATITYSYSRNLRFNVFGNYYKTIKYYESSKFYFEFADTEENFLLDTNSQTRAGMRVDYKIAKGVKVYGSAVYQHRKLDNEESKRFTGGIRTYDIYGFNLSGRYTYIDDYASRDNEYNVEINRNIANLLDVSLYASYEETKLDLENAYTTGSRTYGASLYWPVTKRYYLTMFSEYIDEDDYSSTSIFAQVGYKLSP